MYNVMKIFGMRHIFLAHNKVKANLVQKYFPDVFAQAVTLSVGAPVCENFFKGHSACMGKTTNMENCPEVEVYMECTLGIDLYIL